MCLCMRERGAERQRRELHAEPGSLSTFWSPIKEVAKKIERSSQRDRG